MGDRLPGRALGPSQRSPQRRLPSGHGELHLRAALGALSRYVGGQLDRFCGRADVLPAASGTMTSADLVACAQALVDLAVASASASAGVARLPATGRGLLPGAGGWALNAGQGEAVAMVTPVLTPCGGWAARRAWGGAILGPS